MVVKRIEINSGRSNFNRAVLLLLLLLHAANVKSRTYTTGDSVRIVTLLKNALDSVPGAREKSWLLMSEAKSKSKELDFKYGISMGLYVEGLLYYKSNKMDSAVYLFKESIKLSEEHNFQKNEQHAYLYLARVYQDQGDYDKAIACNQTSLKLLKSNPDDNILAGVYLSLSNLMANSKNFEESIKYDFQALEIYKKLGLPDKIAHTYLYIGYGYLKMHNHKDGFKYLYQSIGLSRSLNNKEDLESAYSSIGAIYAGLQQTDSALYYISNALVLAKELNSKYGEATLLMNLGRLYSEANKLKEAEKYYVKGYELIKSFSDINNIPNYDHNMANFYHKIKNYKKAYEFRTEEEELKDSLYDLDKVKAIGALNAKFETRELENKNASLKKEADLQKLRLQHKDILLYGGGAFVALLLASGLLLVRHNRLRTNQKLILLEQKQLLAQINPHFIFNCLNSVQQFVVQNDTENANKYLADFAMLMRQTLDNSKDFTIPLYREIEYLENYLSLESIRFEDVFSYKITCAEDVDTNAVEIPSMIIQPYVENAINHGLTNLEGKAGILNINFFKKENYLFCEVDDNGIGMENAEKFKEQTFIKHQSRGMEMTRQRLALVSKLNSTDYEVAVINKKNSNGLSEGTTIVIKFPIKA